MTISEKNFADELRIEGITYKGYGVIPKAVTLNHNLTIEAKAIYAYFASFSGGGNSAFPSRCKILADLKISKDRYYKHLKMLLENGLLTIQEKKAGQFTKNVYILRSVVSDLDSSAGLVVMGGINSRGYGLIPKAITTDPRLPIESKGLYAYYAAFTGSGRDCAPSRNDALYHLSLSSDRYSKYRDFLERLGYIQVSQLHQGGKLSKVQITLLDNPDVDSIAARKITVIPDEVNQSPENKDTEKIQSPENKDTANIQPPENKDMEVNQPPENQDTKNESPENQDTRNQDTNNNSIKINNLNNTNFNKREIALEKTYASKSTSSADSRWTFESPVGKLIISLEEKDKIASTFDDIDGLFELAICVLSQRKTEPKSIFHFIWELAINKNWKRKANIISSESKSKSSEKDKLLEKWEIEDQEAYEKRVRLFMQDKGFETFKEAEDAYLKQSEEEMREKLSHYMQSL